MIISPNWLAWRTSTVADSIRLSRSSSVSSRPNSSRLSARRRTQFSTIITAASTTIPKSMAPRLMRLAEMPKYFMPIRANSMASGMIELTINPARI